MKMTIPIKVIVDAIEATMDGWQQFYNILTGEVESVPEYDNDYADMREFEDITAEIEESDNYVRLPSQYELHEYNIMERFAEEKDNAVLMRALHGSRPYRTFKDRAIDLGLDQQYLHSGQKNTERLQESGAGKTEYCLKRDNDYEIIPMQDYYKEQ